MILVFLGRAGVGKGTYADEAAKSYGLLHVASGDLLRAEAKKDTAIGRKIKELMNKGILVPDSITTGLVKQKLASKSASKGVVFDGYPRTLNQARLLDGLLEKAGKKLGIAILFVATDELLLQRLTGRRTCRKCNAIYHITNIPPKKEGICDKCGGELYQRDDDKEDAIRKRWQEYDKEAVPVVDYYKGRGLLSEVASDAEVPVVMPRIKKLIDDIKSD